MLFGGIKMAGGRPNKGSDLVNDLSGSDESKLRLKLILDSIAGKISIKEVCEQLNICESRFHKLRSDVLQNILTDLQPKPKGRPPAEFDKRDEEIKELKNELRKIRLDCKALEIKAEIAVLAPQLLKEDGSLDEQEIERIAGAEKGEIRKSKKKIKKRNQQKKSRKKNR